MSTANIYFPDFPASRESNFYLSFLTLPPPKREAIEAIYAFCRYTDDIVDEAGDEKEKYVRLRMWTDELQKSLSGDSRFPILNRVSKIIQRFNIPLEHFYELIKGMEMDLTHRRYETFEELREYCYRAASTVGLICAEVFGYKKESTKNYAVNLGIALQLTNILRDVRADAKRGRIYLPLEDLRLFGYSETDLFNSVYDERFIALMRYECNRAHDFYRRAKASLAEEDKPLFTAARIMGNIYYLLLLRIERSNYDVFSKKIRLSSSIKFLVVMALRLRSKFPRNFHRYIRTELPA